MGMLMARRLASDGVEIVLLDKSELGREASWAGGGIISPLYPWRYPAPVTALAQRSQTLYPKLIKSLINESGIDPEYQEHGLLMLKVKDHDAAQSWATENTSWLETIEHDALYGLEPNLVSGYSSSLWMPKVASVRNPRLLHALRKIVREHAHIDVRENTEVHSIQNADVELASGGVLSADRVMVCAGAWTSKLLQKTLQHESLKIEPVKGQMIVFDAPKGLLNRVILSDGRYVIPRQDGKVVAGSTLEYKGFDKMTTDEAKQSLYDSAISLLPSLSECPVSHHWAGLRPGSPEGVPSIGALPDMPSVFVNAGHFRNGLVLAPASVELACELLLSATTTLDASPYKVLERASLG